MRFAQLALELYSSAKIRAVSTQQLFYTTAKKVLIPCEMEIRTKMDRNQAKKYQDHKGC